MGTRGKWKKINLFRKTFLKRYQFTATDFIDHIFQEAERLEASRDEDEELGVVESVNFTMHPKVPFFVYKQFLRKT